MRLKTEGKSPAEIRRHIDGKYAKSGRGTATPMPPS
jgi:hypothetical protein